MRPALSHTRAFRRTALALALTLIDATSGCSGTTEPAAWATLTLVSGDNQTVTMDPVGPLTDFPQLVERTLCLHHRLGRDRLDAAGGEQHTRTSQNRCVLREVRETGHLLRL